jgi:hypothetical protein
MQLRIVSTRVTLADGVEWMARSSFLHSRRRACSDVAPNNEMLTSHG